MIDPLSLIPLHIETFFDNKQDGVLHTEVKVGEATAFIFAKDWKEYYLVTNWHVLSGRNPETGKLLSKKGSIPNVIKIWFHAHGDSLMWFNPAFPLLDWETDEKLWKEHIRGREVDIAVLPIKDYLALKLYPLDPMAFNSDIDITPSEPVSIIGFPYGLPSVGVLPIWKTGHIASDIEENYDGKPVFLIDANTKPGMSGSPVIARRPAWAKNKSANTLTDPNEMDRFLGVYSGRVSKKYDSGIGIVWKPELIDEIIDGKDIIISKIVRYKKKPFRTLVNDEKKIINYLKKIPELQKF